MGYRLAIHAFGGKYGLVREGTREAMPLLLAGEAKWLEKWDPKGEVPEMGLNAPPPPAPCKALSPAPLRIPLAMGDLCRMFYGGEHPLHFTVLGTTLCEAWAAPAWEGRQGAEAALVQLFSSGNPTHCVPEHPLTPPPFGGARS